MKIYSVMLEGIDASMGYFINVEVAAPDSTTAAKLATERARELDLKIVGVEEIIKTSLTSGSVPGVMSISGKSYFTAE